MKTQQRWQSVNAQVTFDGASLTDEQGEFLLGPRCDFFATAGHQYERNFERETTFSFAEVFCLLVCEINKGISLKQRNSIT
ncbi:MAG: hypothetical protein EZS28_001737 [Streblomastix strix]|uniref:Uncharacterized protein n=1 Tax=Streblomastix strix TaxID=222440 RepID=A0A5J4X7P1_9EUKA|nr:MAG: hypothetical protein EZS28_001737 [Streblomastix strix]